MTSAAPSGATTAATSASERSWRCFAAIGPVLDVMPFQVQAVGAARERACPVSFEERALESPGDGAPLAADRQRLIELGIHGDCVSLSSDIHDLICSWLLSIDECLSNSNACCFARSGCRYLSGGDAGSTGVYCLARSWSRHRRGDARSAGGALPVIGGPGEWARTTVGASRRRRSRDHSDRISTARCATSPTRIS